MVITNKKNSNRAFRFKTILFFSCLIFSIVTKAQKEETVIDSVVNEVIPAPAEEDETSDDSTGQKKNNFFLKKWEYHSDSFHLQQRNISEDDIKKMQGDDDFWYANMVFEKKKAKNNQSNSSFFDSKLFQTILWIIIVGSFAAFLIWFLAGSNIGLFRKKDKVLNGAGEEELDTEDIFSINYQKEIDKAAQAGNYRLATRLMFLQLLKNMADKNIIQYKQEKTNFDYLMQLHNSRYYPVFFRITRNYEYCWYGQFAVSEEAYRIIKNDFDHLDSQLK